ncbi:hypothetical protein V0M98_26605 [Pseudomonas silesiensis]|jgi:hypothetical protein|nr:hypothetical protein PS838_03493 [Pseudomonas fluorescens]
MKGSFKMGSGLLAMIAGLSTLMLAGLALSLASQLLQGIAVS